MQRRSLVTTLVLLLLGLVAAVSCGPTTTAREEGERLWREGVWDLERVGFEPCIPLLEQAVRDADGAPGQRVAFLLASAYVFTGRDREAEQLMPIVRDGPPAAEPMLIDGYRAAITHTRPHADQALSACIERLGRSQTALADEVAFLAYLWRGEERLWAAAFDPAIADLEEARRYLVAKNAPVHRSLTRSLVEAHRIRRQAAPAEVVARDAAERDPTWAPHAYDLALILAMQVKHEEAQHWFEEALNRDPVYAAPHSKLASLAFTNGDIETARTHLDRYDALTRERAQSEGAPRDVLSEAEILAGYGVYWLAQGRRESEQGNETAARVAWGRSKGSLIRALELHPTCARALSVLIQVGGLLGEDDEVLERWKAELNRHTDRLSKYPAAGDIGRTFC